MTDSDMIGDPSMPPPYRIRVQDEAADLDVKLDKLTAFIESALFDQLDKGEQDLLLQQQVAMINYHEALRQRIALWSAGEPPAAIHAVIGGPAPESDDFVPEESSPEQRAAIIRVLGDFGSIAMLEPPEVFDKHIVGVTLTNDQPRVIYSEQGVIAAWANKEGISLVDAWAAFDAKRNEIRPGGELPPLFMTDIADIMVGAV